MNNELIFQEENFDIIKGITLEERAKLILHTLGENMEEIKNAYRQRVLEHHPDRPAGDIEKFKLVYQAYKILIEREYPTILEASLLANDNLVIDFLGRRVEVLDFIKQQQESEKYGRWLLERFYDSKTGAF